jgi:secreted trypsin-like serine protease
MIREPDGRWLQVGIVSWGREPMNAQSRCAHENLYSVYTRVSQYFDWIARHVQGG